MRPDQDRLNKIAERWRSGRIPYNYAELAKWYRGDIEALLLEILEKDMEIEKLQAELRELRSKPRFERLPDYSGSVGERYL
jgi:hypothetical protein